MSDQEADKAALEAIVSGLSSLIRTAETAKQDLLAFMLEQAKAEAERELATVWNRGGAVMRYVVAVDTDPPDYKVFSRSSDALTHFEAQADEARIFKVRTDSPYEAVRIVKDGGGEQFPIPPTAEERNTAAELDKIAKWLGL